MFAVVMQMSPVWPPGCSVVHGPIIGPFNGRDAAVEWTHRFRDFPHITTSVVPMQPANTYAAAFLDSTEVW